MFLEFFNFSTFGNLSYYLCESEEKIVSGKHFNHFDTRSLTINVCLIGVSSLFVLFVGKTLYSLDSKFLGCN